MFEQNQIQNVFKLAADFAEKLGSISVETEHLLYGVLSDETSVASKILNSFGVTKNKYASVVKSISKNNTSVQKVALSKNVALIYSKINESKGNVQDILYLLLSKKGFKSFVIISSVFGLDVANILKKLEPHLLVFSKNQKTQKQSKRFDNLPEDLKNLGYNSITA